MNAHTYASTLPDATEAAECLLGAILVENASYWKVAGFLKPEHFTEQLHQMIYETAGTMISEGRAVNPITIRQYLPAEEKVGQITVTQYLAHLAAEAVTVSAGLDDYANMIVETWGLRKIIAHAADLDQMARSPSADMSPSKIAAESNATMLRISEETSKGSNAVSMGDAVTSAMTAINDAYRFKKPAGWETGIEAVDQLTGPWEPGQQIVIGGGTKQGKSALAMQCAIGLARHGPVWVYSGEMSLKQLAMREIARRTEIPVWRQKQGRISQQEWEKLERVRIEVEKLPIFIEKRRLTLEQIHQIGREQKSRTGLVSMVVDHVGLLAWGRDDARREEHALSAKATQQLKAIYEDLGIPGVSLVQLKKNTFVGSTHGSFASRLREAIYRRPKYTDLMGAVERDADHVLIPFQARPIIASLEPEAGSDDYLIWEGKMNEQAGRAEIILALSREQPFPQRREVEWHGDTTSFGPAFAGRQEGFDL